MFLNIACDSNFKLASLGEKVGTAALYYIIDIDHVHLGHQFQIQLVLRLNGSCAR